MGINEVNKEKKYLVSIYDNFYQYIVGRIVQFDSLNECKAFYCSWLVGSDYTFKENTQMDVYTYNLVDKDINLSRFHTMQFNEANEILNKLEVPTEDLA